MPALISFLERLRSVFHAQALADLDDATNAGLNVISAPYVIPQNSLNGKKIVIIGTGVAGLTTAYEILSRNDNVSVTLLEARSRTGGRCMSLRHGDVLVEDESSDLYSPPCDQQKVTFEQPQGDQQPYLNAGPGRIPSSHRRLLDYLWKFKVPLEVYVMNSSSNLTQMKNGPAGTAPVVNRRLLHNTRGHIAELVFKNAPTLLNMPESDPKVHQLRSLMVTFGDLDPEGDYAVGTSKPGEDDSVMFSDRAGFVDLPGVTPGKIATPFTLEELLSSEFWHNTRVYQHQDFLWQPTLFQPIGGMDQVEKAFVKQIDNLGGVVHLDSAVTNICYDSTTKQYAILAEGCEEPFMADYCFCNAAMPFLEKMLSKELQDNEDGFEPDFQAALKAIYGAQKNCDDTSRFLAYTTKVGWQGERTLWQGKPFKPKWLNKKDSVFLMDDSEVGVVPIYGGISFTEHPITQIWYPSTGFHDDLGVLTGCYNFAKNAKHSGEMSPQSRLEQAREGAALFSKEFAAGLKHGVAIAWQRIAHIKGGWAQWYTVEDSVKHYNAVVQGTGVCGSEQPSFFIVGDQVSSLPGWQEGAVSSAWQAISRLVMPSRKMPHLQTLPDPRLMVEGV